MTGVYIHVPFCLRKCPYCDFYSVPFSEALADRYTDAVLRAVETQPFGELRAATLYFGGGTPVLLGQNRLRRIVSAANRAFGPAAAEVTLEANPAAAVEMDLPGLRRAGFNRISLGVQSLDDRELAALGRLHSAAEGREAILAAARAGFRQISADLMLAIPGQMRESLAASIEGLAALPVDHISAYLLKIEEGTPFWAQKSALALPDEDAAADLYLDCVERLEALGFRQYEISNFARPGGQSRHNLTYWRCGEYLGIGPAAHSYLGGRRFHFPRDLDAFLAAERPFERIADDGEGGSPAERAMLALRLTEGFAPGGVFPAESAASMLGAAARLEAHGLIRVEEGVISLTPRGFLVSNPAIAALLEAAES